MKADMGLQGAGNLMERRVFLTLAGLGITSFCMNRPIWAKENSSTKPNILLILADDLGYADLGITGCKDIPTPHIDSIAANGIRFSNGYVSCPVLVLPARD
ncbi:MAG TPA: sulfatase-like hydrolase/transferase [Candidatus Hydrogenedentes bacterium]|nr:sulfatase-like hydrolase/transferase [Candidatus Hydrogenedentota bacterium]